VSATRIPIAPLYLETPRDATGADVAEKIEIFAYGQGGITKSFLSDCYDEIRGTLTQYHWLSITCALINPVCKGMCM
jgi:hypothetical protein